MSWADSSVKAVPETHRSRRVDIQGLRAVAVAGVIVAHLGLPFTGGFLGVDVFFVISGFVIVGALLREHSATGRIALVPFYVRRFWRLAPALGATVLAVVVASALIQSPFGDQELTATTAVSAMTMTANAALSISTSSYFDTAAEHNPLLHIWSLSVEEQIYIVAPALIMLALLPRVRSACVVAAVLGSATVVSLVVTVLAQFGLLASLPQIAVGFYSPVTRFWEFGVGALLAILAPRVALTVRAAAAARWLGLALILGSFLLASDAGVWPSLATLVPVAGTALIIISNSERDVRARSLLMLGPLVAVGDRSYALYLWHWPFIVFAGILWPSNPVALGLMAVASFAVALASYRYVEQTFRFSSRTPQRGRLRYAAAVVLVPVLAATALFAATTSDFGQPGVATYRDAVVPLHLGNQSGCVGELPPVSACSWTTSANGRPVYLIGDSNADQFTEPVLRASQDAGSPLYAATANDCPVIDVQISKADRALAADDECQQFARETLSWVERQTPGLVILAIADYYWRDPMYRVQRGDEVAASRSAKVALLQEGMASTLRDIADAGHIVVVVQTVPSMDQSPGNWDPHRCSVIAVVAGACVERISLESWEASRADVRSAVLVAADIPSISVLDLGDVLCPHGQCATEQDGVVLYRDYAHLSVLSSDLLLPYFSDIIGPA